MPIPVYQISSSLLDWFRRYRPGGGLKIKIGAADFPRRPLADTFLHSECNGTSAQKRLFSAIQNLHDEEDMKIIYKTVKSMNVRSRLLIQNKI